MRETDTTAVRWPRVVGTTGIVLGVLMFIDRIDDLLIPLVWSEADWRRMVDPEVAELVARAMPSAPWAMLTGLTGMALAVLLIVASIRLRRKSRSGVALCRTWSWLAIVWLVIDTGRVIWWFTAHADEVPVLASGGWQGYAGCGIVAALALLMAYPIFLLVWFSRPAVRTEVAGWE